MIPPSRARRPSFDAAAAMLRAGLARAPADERAVRRCSARRPDARAARPAPASDRAPDAVAGPRSRAEAARPCEGRRPGTAVPCAGARSGTEPRSRRRRSAAEPVVAAPATPRPKPLRPKPLRLRRTPPGRPFGGRCARLDRPSPPRADGRDTSLRPGRCELRCSTRTPARAMPREGDGLARTA